MVRRPYVRMRRPDGTLQYLAPIKRRRCAAVGNSGRRCRRITLNGMWCNTHAKSIAGLYVGKSSIEGAGKGLFAACKFSKNDLLAYYHGELLSDKELHKRYSNKYTAPYTLAASDKGYGVDCATHRSLASMSNHKDKGNNADLTADENGNLCLAARKTIRPGEEITCNYGKDYWKNAKLQVESCVWL